MKRILTLVLAVMLVCMSLSGCGVPKDKPVTEVWLGDTVDTVLQLEPGLEKQYDRTNTYLTYLSGKRDCAGIEGFLAFQFNPEKQTVVQVSWTATLQEADAQAAFDKLYAEVEASFGKPNQINDNRKTSADLAPYVCFWNGKGYLVTVSLLKGLLEGTFNCAYSVIIPLR
ncbi:MAG TPA: hypothetical protein VN453_06440 [Feifaniaceae bacterium]|nr:hypothetical protein [Feifaniaceae bacterium]